MRTYDFTGHLSPLPPGIKIPLQISGRVCLASEVEQEMSRKDAEIKRLEAGVKMLENVNAKLGEKLRAARKKATAGSATASQVKP